MENKQTLKISVQNLIEYVYLSGDINSVFKGSRRMTEGIKGHQIVQNTRPEDYLAEVPLVFLIERGEIALEINGRIDGLLIDRDLVTLEEIKTTVLPLDMITEEHNLAHWAQAKCYAYIYAEQNDLTEISIQLTYYHIEEKSIKFFVQVLTYKELETFFTKLIDEYIAWAEIIQEWTKIRNESIHKIIFPYANYRKGQRELAVGVYKTIVEGKMFFAQAPTGIGKTLATLFPTIKAMGEGHTSKIFYLTAKTITRTIAEKALENLRQVGLRCKAVTITAKDKICFKNQTLCEPDYCEFAAGYYDRIKEAIQDIFEEDVFNRTIIESYARKHQICPFEFSLDISLWADCIICDYNYAFDPKVYLRRFFLEKGNDYVFLIDEAHNLVERARDMFSAELNRQPISNLQRVTNLILPEVSRTLKKVEDFLTRASEICIEGDRGFHAQIEPPTRMYSILHEFSDQIESWLARSHGAPIYEDMLDLYFAVQSFLRISEYYDDHYVTFVEDLSGDVKLKLFCLDPSFLLSQAMKRGRAAILFSATLTPIEYFTQILGGDETSYKIKLSSPFPRENLCLLMGDRISTKYRMREQTYDQVTEFISAVVADKVGNYLVFFPSYQYMNEIYVRFMDYHPEIKVILQESGMSEAEREEYLAEFTEEVAETLVGFAVMGGIFGEGIDLVGERLSGAIVVGVGLPQICAERNIIKDYFTDLCGQGFEYAYIYPGMNKVLQAMGRVIRTGEDRGVVLLIDPRFASSTYSRLYPSEWHPIPRVRDGGSIRKIINQFWREEPV